MTYTVQNLHLQIKWCKHFVEDTLQYISAETETERAECVSCVSCSPCKVPSQLTLVLYLTFLHNSAISATGNAVSNASHCVFSFTSECPMEMLAVKADTEHFNTLLPYLPLAML